MIKHRPLQLFYIIFSLIFCLGLTACGDDIEVKNQELVVEGWIADGEFPIVIVTSTLPIQSEGTQLSELDHYVAQWARVIIDDGQQQVFLTGMYDSNYFPPYIFTTTAIRGQAGKHYRLIVDWRNMHAEATTTIPQSVPLDKLWCEPCDESDSLRQVMARFHDSPESHDYYLLFSRRRGEPLNPQLCMFGIIDDITLSNSEVTQSIRRGGLVSEEKDYSPYYHIGDEVEVTLMHVDSASYAFWHGFSDSKLLNSSLLFNVSTPLIGNIQGGHGIWYGTGISHKSIYVE